MTDFDAIYTSPFSDDEVEKVRGEWRTYPERYTYAAGRWVATVDRVRAEATAAAEQRLRSAEIVIAAARALVDSWYSGEEGPRYLELRDALNALDSGALDVPDEPMRAHIVVGAIEPATEVGRAWHTEWHAAEAYPGAPRECGSMGCGFLGRILALEAAAPPPASPRQGEPVEGLDAAWREAEAAFPALGGWRMDAVVSHRKGEWKASAVPTPQSRRTANGSTWLGVTGTGPSPVEALRALAVALSEPAEP